MDWRKVAEQAGIDADSVLERMLRAHADMETVETE